MKDKRQRMTVAWPYGLADPSIYACLMTAAAHANINGYPFPALQSAMQSVASPFSPYYSSGAMTPVSPRNPHYPAYNPNSAAENLFHHKSTNSLLDTMSSLSQVSLLQQSLAKSTNTSTHSSLSLNHHHPHHHQLPTPGGLVTTAGLHQSPPVPLMASLFQPYKE